MNEQYRHIKPALPDAIEAEQSLLGSILLDNSAYHKVSGFLKPEHFSEQAHQIVYEIIGKMVLQGDLVTVQNIKPHLPSGQMIGDKSLHLYVIEMLREVVGTKAVVQVANGIKAVWARRSLIGAAEDLDRAARNLPVGMSVSDLISHHTSELVTVAYEVSERTKAVTMAEAIGEAVQSIDDAYKFKRRAGVSTGIASVDELTGPWEPGQQIIIGGGTKQGKSALAMQCAVGLAVHGPVWVYSGEMSVKQLAMREIARRTGIPVWRQKSGKISQSEWEKLLRIREEVERLPIFIEKRRLTLEQIHQIGRELKIERGLTCMVIDHCGLLAWSKDLAKKDEWEQSQIATRELKAIYEDLGIPGMSLVQLKKNTFTDFGRGKVSFKDRMKDAINRRPKYTDMMGAVERDADHVLIPFNASKILAGLEPEAETEEHFFWQDKMKEQGSKAEIILALSREQNFPQRREVEWHGETTSFGPAFAGRQETLLMEDF